MVNIIRFFRLQNSQTKAIILNILSIVCFSIMVIFIRKASENLHILEVVFFQKPFSLYCNAANITFHWSSCNKNE